MLLPGLDADSYLDTLYTRSRVGEKLSEKLKNHAANFSVSGDSQIDLTAAREMLRQKEKELDRQARKHLEERQRKREKTEQEAGYVWRDIHRLEEELDRVREGLELKRIREEKEQRRGEDGRDGERDPHDR